MKQFQLENADLEAVDQRFLGLTAESDRTN
jgi:hypothetical protein